MRLDNDQPDQWKVVVSHSARDHALIVILLFVCVVQFGLQVAGINPVQDLEGLLRSWSAEPDVLIRWGGLLIAVAIYFSLIYDTRRLEVSNAVAAKEAGTARELAYASLAMLEKASEQLKAARGGVGAAGTDSMDHRTSEN